MTRSQQRQGKHGEDLAASVLAARGLECGERIGTPVIVTPAGILRGRPVYNVIWGEKVSGDRHGLLQDGRGVLVETKTVAGDRLIYSKLRPHQPGKLTDWARLGVALLVWVSDCGVFVMRWPVPGFVPGASISVKQARELDIVNLAEIR